MAGRMAWSRCRLCGDVVHQWGFWFPRWRHERAMRRGIPEPPMGHRSYDHRAKPEDWVTYDICSPRIDETGFLQ